MHKLLQVIGIVLSTSSIVMVGLMIKKIVDVYNIVIVIILFTCSICFFAIANQIKEEKELEQMSLDERKKIAIKKKLAWQEHNKRRQIYLIIKLIVLIIMCACIVCSLKDL